MTSLKEIRESFLHLLFPHICKGCGSDELGEDTELCFRCLDQLPRTYFEKVEANPSEKIFWGRCALRSVSAQYYFTKESLIQQLLHQFKYRSDRNLGLQLGRMMGEQLAVSLRFPVEALVPLPLFPAKERKRGYNQAAILCHGIAETIKVPVLQDIVIRPQFTETQTRKGRLERWMNMEGKFLLKNPDNVIDRHILLVDDVMTTGATLEACANELLKAHGLQLSIATLCIANR